MKTIKTQLTFESSEARNFEYPSSKSETVPDMGMSLRDLITNQSKGLLPKLNDSHFSNDYFPDLQRFDVTEIQEMHQDISDTISATEQRLKQKNLIVNRKKKRK